MQTRTNLGHKPQWKKWHQIQNLLGILLKLFGKAKLKGLYYGETFETSFAHLPKSCSCKALTSVFAHSFKLVLTIDP